MSKKMLQRIHDDFIKKIPSFNISEYRSTTPWTDAITLYFHELGEQKGYQCRSKLRNGEHMGLDMVWKKADGNIILALEHENDQKLEKMTQTELSKLVDIKSPNKIMMCYPGKEDQITLKRFQNMIKENKYSQKEHYLLMMGSQGEGNRTTDPFIRFETYLIDNLGNIVWKKDTGIIPTTSEVQI